MPELSPDKLIERLAKGKTVPAIVLEGTDPYLREMCRNKIIDSYVPEAVRDWALGRITVRGGEWSELFQRAETMPMLASCQVVLVDGAESIQSRAKDGDDADDEDDDGDDPRKDTLKALAEYLAKPAPFTVLVFEVPKLDHRQRLYKVLAESAVIVELTLGNESAAAFAEQMAKELDVEIERAAANLLAEIVNSEPARIRVEVQKLAAYVQGRRGRITSADVEELVPKARKNTVWQLADMLATRRRADAFEFLENLLREGEEPIGLVGVLAWMYRKLIEARDLPAGMNGFQAARPLGMRPDAAEAAVRNARRIPKKDLLAGLLALAETDSQLKSSNPNPRALMEFLIARLTSSASSAAAAP